MIRTCIRRCIPYDVGLWPSLLWVQQSRRKPTFGVLGVSSDPRPIRQRTTRATALEMAAQLPALQWYVWSPRHEASARLHPGAQRPTARRQRFLFSFLCPHTATLGVSTRDPLAPASEAHAANSEGEDALRGKVPPSPLGCHGEARAWAGLIGTHASFARTPQHFRSYVDGLPVRVLELP